MSRQTFRIIGRTCGNPVRLVAAGGSPPQGATTLEKRAHSLAEDDRIRTGLTIEPRGHDIMSGRIRDPPTRPDCDVPSLSVEISGCHPTAGMGRPTR